MSLRFWGAEKPVRAFKEMNGLTIGGSVGRVISYVLGNYVIRGVSISSSETSSEMAIRNFYSVHLCPEKYLSSQL
jgi:hypothetical protein